MKNIISILIILFFTNYSETAAQEKLIAGKNNTISVSSFTINFPDKYLQGNTKWTIRKKSDEFDIIELVGIDETGIPLIAYTMKKYSMEFFMNQILSDSIRQLTNDSIAANFFEYQLKEMIALDAKDKKMAIRDHRTGNDTINAKYFYTFSYAVQNKKENLVALGYLYVYFPRESGNEEFFVAYFSEPMNATAYKKSSVAKWLGCFREILGTLVINEKSSPLK